jgi:ATP-dependent protease HslVU (ClpYQ) peptidase subunit
MTVIAWDGHTLAADKLAGSVGLRRTVTKIRAIRGHLVAFSGNAGRGMEVVAWWEAGAYPAEYPKFQEADDFVDLLVITPVGKILKYERSAHPVHFEDATFAMGSGRDYAMATMFLGFGAVRAVEVASEHDMDCGGGLDVLMLPHPNQNGK